MALANAHTLMHGAGRGSRPPGLVHHGLVLVGVCLLARCLRRLWLLAAAAAAELTHTHHRRPLFFCLAGPVVAGKIPERPQIGRSTFLAPKLVGPS